ncbi:MAG TPA: type II and III secretion system protein [Puia sp.]|nr:type II and III secretion system protein [Puia sp.]
MPKRPYRIPGSIPLLCLLLPAAYALACVPLRVEAQVQPQEERFQMLEKRLKDLSAVVPGLKQKADLSVTNISLQEFLQGLASTHNLNLNIDPSLNQKVSNYFSDETVENILLYIARQFNLEFTFIGSIITIGPYRDPGAGLPPPPRQLNISYNPSTRELSFDLRDDSLSEVAKKITRLSGRNIVVLPELYSRRVTGFVQNLPLTGAMEKLAIVNSFKLNSTNDSALVLEPLRQDEELVTRENPDPNANYSIRRVTRNANAPASSSIEVSRDRGGGRHVTLNVVNAPIKEIVKTMAEQAGINYFEYSDLAGSATASVTDMDFERALGLVLKDSHYTFTVDGGVYLIGDRKNEGLRTQRLIQLQYRSADSLLDIIPRELREGVEMREFKELNGFLLSGSEPQIREIEAFVRQVDKVVPMITLEVIILDVNKGKSISTGISAGTSDSVRPGGTLLGPSGINFTFGSKDINQFLSNVGLNNVFNLGKVSPSFYISISALENNTNVNQRQTPKLSTLNGHTANLSIGNTQYYQITTQNVLGSLNPQTVVTQQFVPVEANLSIDITPFVAGDDEVTMHINVSISNFTSSSTTITQPPPTSTSKFRSIIRVRNEDMIVLGGIERTVRSETVSGIPLLSRIPILKWIFSSRTKSDSKVVSVVFIKPTITYR